jgi:hypothetical protein
LNISFGQILDDYGGAIMDANVNAGEWNGLTVQDREKIQAIISSHFKDVTVKGDANTLPAKEFMDQAQFQKFNFSNPLCTAACAVAEAAAVAACSALSGGVAIAICVAAAHEAGNFCRSKC